MMKIVIEPLEIAEEEEIIFKIHGMTSKITRIIDILKSQDDITVYEDNKASLLPVLDIFYIESVDLKTFVYAKDKVYLSKARLYELEEQLVSGDFLRISKKVIVNLRKVKNVAPYAGGRFEAELINGEKVIISRLYVPEVKRRFGLL